MIAEHEKVAVVTGGTSGIGLATAQRLLKDGYRVAVFGQRHDQAVLAKQALTALASDEWVISGEADLTNPPSIRTFLLKWKRAGDPRIFSFAAPGFRRKAKMAQQRFRISPSMNGTACSR